MTREKLKMASGNLDDCISILLLCRENILHNNDYQKNYLDYNRAIDEANLLKKFIDEKIQEQG